MIPTRRQPLIGIRAIANAAGLDPRDAYALITAGHGLTVSNLVQDRRITEMRRKKTALAGWDEFIASTELAFAPDWDELIETFDTIW